MTEVNLPELETTKNNSEIRDFSSYNINKKKRPKQKASNNDMSVLEVFNEGNKKDDEKTEDFDDDWDVTKNDITKPMDQTGDKDLTFENDWEEEKTNTKDNIIVDQNPVETQNTYNEDFENEDFNEEIQESNNIPQQNETNQEIENEIPDNTFIKDETIIEDFNINDQTMAKDNSLIEDIPMNSNDQTLNKDYSIIEEEPMNNNDLTGIKENSIIEEEPMNNNDETGIKENSIIDEATMIKSQKNVDNAFGTKDNDIPDQKQQNVTDDDFEFLDETKKDQQNNSTENPVVGAPIKNTVKQTSNLKNEKNQSQSKIDENSPVKEEETSSFLNMLSSKISKTNIGDQNKVVTNKIFENLTKQISKIKNDEDQSQLKDILQCLGNNIANITGKQEDTTNILKIISDKISKTNIDEESKVETNKIFENLTKHISKIKNDGNQSQINDILQHVGKNIASMTPEQNMQDILSSLSQKVANLPKKDKNKPETNQIFENMAKHVSQIKNDEDQAQVKEILQSIGKNINNMAGKKEDTTNLLNALSDKISKTNIDEENKGEATNFFKKIFAEHVSKIKSEENQGQVNDILKYIGNNISDMTEKKEETTNILKTIAKNISNTKPEDQKETEPPQKLEDQQETETPQKLEDQQETKSPQKPTRRYSLIQKRDPINEILIIVATHIKQIYYENEHDIKDMLNNLMENVAIEPDEHEQKQSLENIAEFVSKLKKDNNSVHENPDKDLTNVAGLIVKLEKSRNETNDILQTISNGIKILDKDKNNIHDILGIISQHANDLDTKNKQDTNVIQNIANFVSTLQINSDLENTNNALYFLAKHIDNTSKKDIEDKNKNIKLTTQHISKIRAEEKQSNNFLKAIIKQIEHIKNEDQDPQTNNALNSITQHIISIKDANERNKPVFERVTKHIQELKNTDDENEEEKYMQNLVSNYYTQVTDTALRSVNNQSHTKTNSIVDLANSYYTKIVDTVETEIRVTENDVTADKIIIDDKKVDTNAKSIVDINAKTIVDTNAKSIVDIASSYYTRRANTKINEIRTTENDATVENNRITENTIQSQVENNGLNCKKIVQEEAQHISKVSENDKQIVSNNVFNILGLYLNEKNPENNEVLNIFAKHLANVEENSNKDHIFAMFTKAYKENSNQQSFNNEEDSKAEPKQVEIINYICNHIVNLNYDASLDDEAQQKSQRQIFEMLTKKFLRYENPEDLSFKFELTKSNIQGFKTNAFHSSSKDIINGISTILANNINQPVINNQEHLSEVKEKSNTNEEKSEAQEDVASLTDFGKHRPAYIEENSYNPNKINKALTSDPNNSKNSQMVSFNYTNSMNSKHILDNTEKYDMIKDNSSQDITYPEDFTKAFSSEAYLEKMEELRQEEALQDEEDHRLYNGIITHQCEDSLDEETKEIQREREESVRQNLQKQYAEGKITDHKFFSVMRLPTSETVNIEDQAHDYYTNLVENTISIISDFTKIPNTEDMLRQQEKERKVIEEERFELELEEEELRIQNSQEEVQEKLDAILEEERIIKELEEEGFTDEVMNSDTIDYEREKQQIEDREAELLEKEKILVLEEERFKKGEYDGPGVQDCTENSHLKNNSISYNSYMSPNYTKDNIANNSVLNASYMNRTENTMEMDVRLMKLEQEKIKLDNEKKQLEDEEKQLMMENSDYKIWKEKNEEKNKVLERTVKLEKLRRSLKIKVTRDLKLIRKTNFIFQKITNNLKLNIGNLSKKNWNCDFTNKLKNAYNNGKSKVKDKKIAKKYLEINSLDYFKYSPSTIDKCFRTCRQEDLVCNLDRRLDEAIDLCINNVEEWKNVEKSGISTKDLSVIGGSGTFLVATGDKSVNLHYQKLVVFLRRFCEDDAMSEKRMLDAHKLFWEKELTVPRLVSGTNWYIEPFYEGPKVEEHREDVDWAEVTAKIHKQCPTDWYNDHRSTKQEMWPVLKNAFLGAHIWQFACRAEWFNPMNDQHEFWISAQKEPLSKAGQRFATVHGNYHEGNAQLDSNKQAYVINFEFTCVQWAITDIAYAFSYGSFKTSKYEDRVKFCKRYLEVIGLPNDEESADLLIFDAECQGFMRIFHKSKICTEMDVKAKDPSYDYKFFNLYDKFEEKAREDKDLIKRIAQEGFEKVAIEDVPELKEQLRDSEIKEWESMDVQLPGQKRDFWTQEEEVKHVLNAVPELMENIKVEEQNKKNNTFQKPVLNEVHNLILKSPDESTQEVFAKKIVKPIIDQQIIVGKALPDLSFGQPIENNKAKKQLDSSELKTDRTKVVEKLDSSELKTDRTKDTEKLKTPEIKNDINLVIKAVAQLVQNIGDYRQEKYENSRKQVVDAMANFFKNLRKDNEPYTQQFISAALEKLVTDMKAREETGKAKKFVMDSLGVKQNEFKQNQENKQSVLISTGKVLPEQKTTEKSARETIKKPALYPVPRSHSISSKTQSVDNQSAKKTVLSNLGKVNVKPKVLAEEKLEVAPDSIYIAKPLLYRDKVPNIKQKIISGRNQPAEQLKKSTHTNLQPKEFSKKVNLKDEYINTDENELYLVKRDESFEQLPVKHYETIFQRRSDEEIKIPSKSNSKGKNVTKIVDMETFPKTSSKNQIKRYDTIFEPENVDAEELQVIKNLPSNRSFIRDSGLYSQQSKPNFDGNNTKFAQGMFSAHSDKDFDLENTSQININYIKTNRTHLSTLKKNRTHISSLEKNRTQVSSPLKYRKNYELEKIVKQAEIEKEKLRARLKKIDSTINDIKLRANSNSKSFNIKKSRRLSGTFDDSSEPISLDIASKPTILALKKGSPILLNKAKDHKQKYPRINQRRADRFSDATSSKLGQDDTLMLDKSSDNSTDYITNNNSADFQARERSGRIRSSYDKKNPYAKIKTNDIAVNEAKTSQDNLLSSWFNDAVKDANKFLNNKNIVIPKNHKITDKKTMESESFVKRLNDEKKERQKKAQERNEKLYEYWEQKSKELETARIDREARLEYEKDINLKTRMNKLNIKKDQRNMIQKSTDRSNPEPVSDNKNSAHIHRTQEEQTNINLKLLGQQNLQPQIQNIDEIDVMPLQQNNAILYPEYSPRSHQINNNVNQFSNLNNQNDALENSPRSHQINNNVNQFSNLNNQNDTKNYTENSKSPPQHMKPSQMQLNPQQGNHNAAHQQRLQLLSKMKQNQNQVMRPSSKYKSITYDKLRQRELIQKAAEVEKKECKDGKEKQNEAI